MNLFPLANGTPVNTPRKHGACKPHVGVHTVAHPRSAWHATHPHTPTPGLGVFVGVHAVTRTRTHARTHARSRTCGRLPTWWASPPAVRAPRPASPGRAVRAHAHAHAHMHVCTHANTHTHARTRGAGLGAKVQGLTALRPQLCSTHAEVARLWTSTCRLPKHGHPKHGQQWVVGPAQPPRMASSRPLPGFREGEGERSIFPQGGEPAVPWLVPSGWCSASEEQGGAGRGREQGGARRGRRSREGQGAGAGATGASWAIWAS